MPAASVRATFGQKRLGSVRPQAVVAAGVHVRNGLAARKARIESADSGMCGDRRHPIMTSKRGWDWRTSRTHLQPSNRRKEVRDGKLSWRGGPNGFEST